MQPLTEPLRRLSGAALGLFLFLPGHPLSAPAAGPGPSREIAVDWADAGWSAAAVAAAITGQIRYANMPSVDSSRLHRSDLLPIDRWAAGRYSPGADLASNLLAVPFCALPVALTGLEALQGKAGWNVLAADALVMSEAYAFASSFALIVRSLRVHPRPLVYGTEAPAQERESGQASGSFFSGHASAAFMAATYLSYTYPLRHPEFQGEAWLWAGSLGTAGCVAALRVAAGKHFPTDVAVGAASGALIGWLVPRLHTRTKSGGSISLILAPTAVQPMLVWNF